MKRGLKQKKSTGRQTLVSKVPMSKETGSCMYFS